MHDKLFFSLAILSYPIDPHTLIIDFLSYQASLAYNPKEFLGVQESLSRDKEKEGDTLKHRLSKKRNLQRRLSRIKQTYYSKTR
jgi:hypothetical protein